MSAALPGARLLEIRRGLRTEWGIRLMGVCCVQPGRNDNRRLCEYFTPVLT